MDRFILLDKLDNYGLSDVLLRLLSSYLLLLNQFVHCGGVNSFIFNWTTGVP